MEQPKRLADLDFIDLYLGDGYAEFKGLNGEDKVIQQADQRFMAEINEVRAKCMEFRNTSRRREFSFVRHNILYRVASFTDVGEQTTFVLRQKKKNSKTLASTGLSRRAQESLLDPALTGAVLVVGRMSSGKTTTVTSAVSERLQNQGGMALVLEDPVETRLTGKWGKGRAIQIEVSGEYTSYQEELIRGMRSNADMFVIGEVRDGVTASEFLRAGSNGHLLYSTFHAQSIGHSLTRLRSLIGGNANSVNMLMSQSLSLIIYQEIQRSPKVVKDAQGKVIATSGFNSRMSSHVLQIKGHKQEEGIRAKIASGEFGALNNIAQVQGQREIWANKAVAGKTVGQRE